MYIYTSTRSTIEVARFRYFLSERRSSLSPKRRNANFDFGKKNVLETRATGLFAAMQLDFAEVSFRVRYGALQVRSLRNVKGASISIVERLLRSIYL